MKILIVPIFLVCVLVVLTLAKRKTVALDEQWVCLIKRSCLECLRLPHCSWCQTENKCFSSKLPSFSDFCINNTIQHKNYGFSLEDNAECACSSYRKEEKRHCYPEGVTEGIECSGRGECVCGRCVCDDPFDSNYPTKMIMGEFCEFDNFSCDGPKCNEGPYSLTQPEENSTKQVDLVTPEE